MRSPRITLKDIAQASGVDISTVSRSLTGSYGINKQTRERVLAVAARLNYHPIRALSRGAAGVRSRTIGLIVSDIRNPFFAEVVRGAEDAASSAGCELVLCNSDLDATKQIRYIQSLLNKGVDGVVMNSVAGLDRVQQERLARSGIPVVLLNRPRSGSNFSTVTADNTEGGYLVGEYLSRLGHCELAHITGPREHGNLRERARGFLRGVAAGGCTKTPVVMHGSHTFQGGYDLAQMILADHPNVTAVFAANDIMAFGAVRAFHDAGVEVPRDISIAGFDNVELATAVHPALTTVHQPKYELGRAAVGMILVSAENKEPHLPEHRQMGVKLIERESCSAPQSANHNGQRQRI